LGSVSGSAVEVLFAPAKAFDGGVKLFFGGWDDALAVQSDEVPMSGDARFEAFGDFPNARLVVSVGARSDEAPVHRTVMVGTEGEAVIGSVVLGFFERDYVSSFDERK